jgi:fucose permease
MSKTTPSATYAGGLTRAQVVAWRNAIFAIFAICGVAMATWVSRIPSVRDAFQADTFTVGILAFGIAAGSIFGLVASSHIISRLGAARTILVMLITGAVGLTLAAVAATVGPNFALTIAGLVVFGAAFGICDVAMNVNGAAQERVLGKPIMPIFHAFFSFGTMAGAGIAVLAEVLHLSIAAHVGIIAALMVVTVLFAVRHLQSEHIVEDGAEPVPDDDHSRTWRGRLSIWRDPRTILIGLIVLGMAFTEGSANDWLALAMVDGHDVTKANGALIFGVFVTAMTVGRLAGVKVLERFGRVPVLRGTAILAVVGLVIVIFGPNAYVATVGVVLWGLGASLGFPVGMSAAADDPKTAAARVSAVATIGYFAFLVGPPAIGFLGQHFGLLNGLLAVLVLVVVAGLVSGAAREPGAAKGVAKA